MKTPEVRLASREELLGYVPYALGFHPKDSIVLLGLGRRHIEVCARADAGWPTRHHVKQLAMALRRARGVSRIFLIGYGSKELAGPVSTIGAALEARGYAILELLRVDGDRFFCLRCDGCTPPGGAGFEVTTSAAAAAATYAGIVVRPDRQAVQKLVRPIGGLAALAMTQAVDRAERRLNQMDGEMREAGVRAVDAALAVARQRKRLTDDDAAWLSLVLHDTAVRDHAWKHTDAAPWQQALWLDLTRRAEPSLAAPPAALLGWCAWRQGDGALSIVAVQRALRIDPGNLLAQFVARRLEEAQPPGTVRRWPFPLG